MHSPKAVAHEIYLGRKKKKNGHYRNALITIWHNDPETDGTDDSCGWFIRGRHVKKDIIEKVTKAFENEWDTTFKGDSGHVYNTGWFNPEGENILSVRGITLNMYLRAAKVVFDPDGTLGADKMWDKTYKFLRKNYVEIMIFSENNFDSLRDIIVRKFEIGCKEPYDKKRRDEMIENCARIITCDILRKSRPWYKHPRWHIHHWSLQIHPLQNFKRRFWDKCCVCNKRGFKGAAMGDWDGTKLWHESCDNTAKNNIPVETNV